MTTRKPILCLDFDGVIHSYTSGWKGLETITDPPVPGAIEFIIRAVQTFDVRIFSSRSFSPWGIAAMKRWLRSHAAAHFAADLDDGGHNAEAAAAQLLGHVSFPTEKPPALVTIDDRALTFTGTWPSIEELLAFQPWNKRPAPSKLDDLIVDNLDPESPTTLREVLLHGFTSLEGSEVAVAMTDEAVERISAALR